MVMIDFLTKAPLAHNNEPIEKGRKKNEQVN
jgi:hypothetical protein